MSVKVLKEHTNIVDKEQWVVRYVDRCLADLETVTANHVACLQELLLESPENIMERLTGYDADVRADFREIALLLFSPEFFINYGIPADQTKQLIHARVTHFLNQFSAVETMTAIQPQFIDNADFIDSEGIVATS